jgi:hypothetical protein
MLQHLPSIFLLLAVFGSFLLGTAISTIPFVCFGTYGAWVYLRFLQMNSELAVRCVLRMIGALHFAHLPVQRGHQCIVKLICCRGTRFNEDFRFASFFPEAMHPAVDRVAETLGRALKLHPGAAPAQGAGQMSAAAALPGSDDADASRRRCGLMTGLGMAACKHALSADVITLAMHPHLQGAGSPCIGGEAGGQESGARPPHRH